MRQKHGSLRKRREALARTNREFIRLGSKNNAYERGGQELCI